MKRLKLLLFSICMFLFIGCTKEDGNVIPVENNIDETGSVETDESINIDESGSTEIPEKNTVLSEEELEVYTNLFNTPEYLGFLLTPFNSVEDIDYSSVFLFGAGINDEFKEGEEEDYLEETERNSVYGTLQILRADSVKTYLETHLGISDFTAPDIYYWDYLESRDTYYYYHWESPMDEYRFECISGEKNGNNVSLKFQLEGEEHYGNKADRILEFTESNGNYIIKSNSIQWFDHCDESKNFEIKLPDSNEPIQFITYEPNSNGAVEIYLVKDGKFISNVATEYWQGNEKYPFEKVNEVSFFDFNVDGIDDILVTGECALGECFILEESVSEKYYYESCYLLEEKISEDLEDFSADNIKNILLGDNKDCKFDNYKDAYAHMAHLKNLCGEELSYGLLYTDDDEIPELVINSGGFVSLYTFEDNHLTCLMHEWGYGAFGNAGYYYAPRKGVFYNLNNDHAGAVKYESYMLKHPGQELKADYTKKSLWFNDLDGNGEPSEDEWNASEEWKEYEAKYYNGTDAEMSEEEIKAQFDLYSEYDFEFVSGDMDYDTFINHLYE